MTVHVQPRAPRARAPLGRFTVLFRIRSRGRSDKLVLTVARLNVIQNCDTEASASLSKATPDVD